MAIKFEDNKGDSGKPAVQAPSKAKERLEEGTVEPTEPGSELPFGKPQRPEKKGQRRR